MDARLNRLYSRMPGIQVKGPGPKPHFVLLLADSGLGKTRIFHEFYHQISVEEKDSDRNGYWPDRLCEDFQAMRVNAAVCNPARPIPWLWWGLRWTQHMGMGASSPRDVPSPNPRLLSSRNRMPQNQTSGRLAPRRIAE